jgi:hypothetical protein
MAFLIPILITTLITTGVELGLAWLSKAINPTPTSGRLGQDDFHSLESAYTLPLPKCWGTERVPANITWVSPVREHKYNVGGGLLSDGVDVFYYTQDVEYSFTLGPAKAFIKIFLGDKVIYDKSGPTDDGTSAVFGNNLAQAFFNLIGSSAGAAKDRLLESFELFLGTETQQPSAIVSAVEGFGTVPADRGIVKIVIKNLNLTKLGGNALPAASAIIQFAEYTTIYGSSSVSVKPTSASSSGPIYLFGGTTQSGDGEANTDGGTVQMWHSCGLCDWSAWAYWSDFSVPNLPSGAVITAIVPTCEAVATDLDVFDISYVIGAAPYATTPSGVSPGETTDFAPIAEAPVATIHGASIGTDAASIVSASMFARFFQTLSLHTPTELPPYPTLTVSNPRLEVQYNYPLVPPTGTTLALIVADLCVEAGLTADQFDVTQLESTLVKGFKTEQKAIRDVVRELMDVYPFDGYESDGMLKFVLRSGNPVVTIGEDDLVLSGDADSGYRISEPITQENEIPMKVDVHYADIDRDFQDNVQHSKRIIEPSPTMESITIKSISTNVVMNANEARRQQSATCGSRGRLGAAEIIS